MVMPSLEPETVINVDDEGYMVKERVSVSAPASIREGSSSKLRHFSEELQVELVRRFSWSHDHTSAIPMTSTMAQASARADNNYALALEARAQR
jgi:hypothetical protein